MNKNQSIIFCSGLIIFFLLSFQYHAQTNLKILTNDYNKDGSQDSLIVYYSGGGGYGGKYATLVDGKTKKIYDMNTSNCFCAIKQVLVVPENLKIAENKPFLLAIINSILPDERSKPDASLEWIISGFNNYNKLKNHNYFNLIIKPFLHWKKSDEFDLPGYYYLRIYGDTLNILSNELHNDGKKNSSTNDGFLIYYGHNHYRNPSRDSTILVAANNNYEIYRTSHGIFARKGIYFKWLFVSDIDLTGAPEKLRWESIGKTKLINKYVVLQQDLGLINGSNMFLIDIESGVTGRIRLDNTDSDSLDYGSEEWTYDIKSEHIVFTSDNGRQRYIELMNLLSSFDDLKSEN